MKTLKVLTKAGHSLDEDPPAILECLQEIASYEAGMAATAHGWLSASTIIRCTTLP